MKILLRQISGLGNQLFQFAAAYYYATRYGAHLEVATMPARKASSHGYPRPFLLSNFSITSPCHELTSYEQMILLHRRSLAPVQFILKRISGIQVIREKISERYKFYPDLALEPETRTLYLVGYWQAYRFANEVERELRDQLAFRDPPHGRNLEALRKIENTENSVSLHIRRGDYTLDAEGNIALPISYYQSAIKYFDDRFGNPTFFVFSDEMEFARQNLPRESRFVFFDHNDARSAHEDLRLMSSCQNHVIANSTFSWWAAWMNPNPDKIVFSPRNWLLRPGTYFPDLLPPDWILEDNEDGIHLQGGQVPDLN